MTYDRSRLIALLKRDALKTGEFSLAGGGTSGHYVDARQVTLSAEGAALIGVAVLDLLDERPGVTAVGGPTMGADPIVAATLAVAGARGVETLRGFLVRNEIKAHGTGRLVEGAITPGATAVILDDVATTGGSALRAADAVRAMGCTVAGIIVVLDRLEGASQACAARGIDFRSLLTIHDLGIESVATDAPRGAGTEQPDPGRVPQYAFYRRIARTINSRQSNAILVHGNVHDVYFCGDDFVSLRTFLSRRFDLPGIARVLYRQNRPIEFFGWEATWKATWVRWRLSMAGGGSQRDQVEVRFEEALRESAVSPGVALEFLRQLTTCWRDTRQAGMFIVILDDADLILPAGDGDISRLSPDDRRNIAVAQDWLSDPDFLGQPAAVVMIAEGLSQVHPKVARLPQLIPVEVSNPGPGDRKFFIERFRPTAPEVADREAAETAGLSLHALRQLLLDGDYSGTLDHGMVVAKVEGYIRGQVGDEVVEYYRPGHTLDDLVGATALKKFLAEKFIPRCRLGSRGSLSGAIVAGPIGGGKSYTMAAVAAALGIPVLVLKNIRSQWFGQTDVIFERLRRVLESLDAVMIFVDEADTQGFGVGRDVQETDRRLAGKMQAMMGDPELRGRVVWLLMTARPELISPDIRRPGRAGDLIIPVLDPEGADREAFIRWLSDAPLSNQEYRDVAALTADFSPATFASIRAEARDSGIADWPGIRSLMLDTLESDIKQERRYQTLQALLNCTRLSLLPAAYQDPKEIASSRRLWREELAALRAGGYGS